MTAKPRYLALDVFRGATVFLMIVVNSPGEWGVQYGPLQHADWHGFTLTDLVFPSFLFAVGNAMAFTMDKYHENKRFWSKIIKRTILIFLIGFLLSWFPFFDFDSGSMYSLANARIMGVLQRIALCYFFASLLIHFFEKKALWIWSAALLVGYWFLVYHLGGMDPYSLSGFIGNNLDKLLFGQSHLYTGEGVPFDPEGLLSTIPAIVNVVLGYFAGKFIQSKGSSYEGLSNLLIVGVVLIISGLWWDLFFPINKKIWTSSFVLLTAGIDVIALGILVYFIEMKNLRKWTYFFEVFGRNPLFIYALSGILITILYTIPAGDSNLQAWIYNSFKIVLPPAHASFLFALVYTLINWFVGYLLDKKKIYIKV
jgi:predicted acyltransferase